MRNVPHNSSKYSANDLLITAIRNVHKIIWIVEKAGTGYITVTKVFVSAAVSVPNI